MENVAVLISTYDYNVPLWIPFAHGFRKYWSDCPFPIYFMTNELDGPIGTTLKLGKDTDWVRMTRKALSLIKEEIIIWMMEDYWLVKQVQTNKVLEFCKFVKEKKADYIRLMNAETSAVFETWSPDLKEYSLDSPNKTSLGPSIWRKQLFQRLLVDGETVWKFEQNSAARTYHSEQFFAIKDNNIFLLVYPPHYKRQPMEKGEITEAAYDYVEREGIVNANLQRA